MAKNSPRPWTRAIALAVRKRFQGEVYRRLHARSTFDPEARIRHKIARFDFSDRSRTQAYRGLIAFDKLRVLVPPRVVAAVFSTIWNRWTTARRFQRRDTPSNICCLGCASPAEDSLEHYARCSVLRDFASQRLRYSPQDGTFLPDWCGARLLDDSTRTKAAIMAYIAYRASNTARHQGGLQREAAIQCLGQLLHDAVRNHSLAATVVESVFVPRARRP